MQLKLRTDAVSIKLSTKDDSVDFKALVKVYELVTGDELEINETEPSHPEPKSSKPATDRGGVNTITDDLTPDSTPGWHEPVKTELMCPYCHVQHRSDVLPDNDCYAKPIVGDYNHLGAGLCRGGDSWYFENWADSTEQYTKDPVVACQMCGRPLGGNKDETVPENKTV